MLRKTWAAIQGYTYAELASMRPQRNAAENLYSEKNRNHFAVLQ